MSNRMLLLKYGTMVEQFFGNRKKKPVSIAGCYICHKFLTKQSCVKHS